MDHLRRSRGGLDLFVQHLHPRHLSNQLFRLQRRYLASKSHYVPFPLSSFTTVMMLVTFKLSTHTKFWSWILLISILFFSLGLYLAYMWISNYYFSDYVYGSTYMFFTEG